MIISHRGNLNGPNHETENNPIHIIKVLSLGYDCEIDVWKIKKTYYLGHDKPEYKISEDFLKHKKLWCHAKNIAALNSMLKNKEIHCFWHENDKVTLTSKGYIWAFPTKNPIKNSIVVLPELYNNINGALGICSDFAANYK